MPRNTKEKILTAAREVFATKGFDGCSVDEIAARAGVNKASLYYHFGGKASLYDKVLTDNLAEFLHRVRLAVAGAADPEAKLTAFVRAYGENFECNRAMAPLMLRELASDGAHLSEGIKKTLNGIILEVDAILKQGQETGVFRKSESFVTYIMMVGSMNIFTSATGMRQKFAADQSEIGFAISSQDAAREIAATVLYGLKK